MNISRRILLLGAAGTALAPFVPAAVSALVHETKGLTGPLGTVVKAVKNSLAQIEMEHQNGEWYTGEMDFGQPGLSTWLQATGDDQALSALVEKKLADIHEQIRRVVPGGILARDDPRRMKMIVQLEHEAGLPILPSEGDQAVFKALLDLAPADLKRVPD